MRRLKWIAIGALGIYALRRYAKSLPEDTRDVMHYGISNGEW